MHRHRTRLLISIIASLCFFGFLPLVADATPASLSFALSSSTVSGAAGTTIELFATLTNNGSDQISFTGDAFSLGTGFLTGDDTPFFSFLLGPATLDASQSTGSFDILNISIDPSAIPGSYGPNLDSNSFTVDWTDSVTGASFATSENFTVGVASTTIPTPEPGTLTLLQLALGLSALTLGFRRWRGRDPVAEP